MAFKPLTEEQWNKAIEAGFTPEQIIAMEKKRKQQESGMSLKDNYFQETGKDIAQIGSEIKESFMERGEKVDKATNLFQKFGQGAGFASDVIGSVFKGAVKAFLPQKTEEGIKGGIEKVITPVMESEIAQNIIKKYNSLDEETKKNVDAAIGIGSLALDLAGGLGAKTATKETGKILTKGGLSLEKSGLSSRQSIKQNFAQELVMPIETKSVKLQQVGRTVESKGLLKEDIIIPTENEVMMAKEISEIPGISSKNTYQKNFNVIRDYNLNKAKQLELDIKKYDFGIPKEETIKRLDDAAQRLKESPTIVGDAEKTANKLLEGAKKFVNENDSTGSGLLKARKEYDNWVLSQKPKAFDAGTENAFTLANREVRNTLNDVLNEGSLNLGIKDSLSQQSLLYKAMDNVAPKAAQEANTKLGRIMQSVEKRLGTRNKIVQGLAALTGIGVFGASVAYAMPLTIGAGLGFFLYQGGKLIVKPQVRILLGRLLQQTGKILKLEDKKFIEEVISNYK